MVFDRVDPQCPISLGGRKYSLEAYLNRAFDFSQLRSHSGVLL